MRWYYILRLRLRSLFKRENVDRELREELEYHLSRQMEQHIAQGAAPSEALYAARRRMDGMEQRFEECRDMRRVNYVEDLLSDLLYAQRSLRKNPGFAVLAILTLALGIGSSTALFSLVNAVLFRPLPMEKPDRLAVIWEASPQAGIPKNNPAPANFIDWKTQNHSFDDMAAGMASAFNLTGDGEPQRLAGYRTTMNFLTVLGIRPALGRLPSASDFPPDAKLAVISEGFWQRHYGGDSHVIGRTITLNSEPYTLIGIAPAGFQFPSKGIEIWVTAGYGSDELAQRGSHYLFVVGRLKDGVSFEQANADLAVICRALQEQYPQSNKGLESVVVPLREHYSGNLRFSLNLLLAAVSIVLLIACSNLANLLLTRATTRHSEIALRAALGAGRARVVRQLLTESILMALLGAMLGALFASGTFRFLARLVPDTFPEGTAPSFDPTVWGFTVAIALITGLAFGIGPALKAARLDLNEVLKQSASRGSAAALRTRVRDLLVVSEMTLTVVLLISAGLMVASYAKLRSVDVGFRAEQLLILETSLPTAKYGSVLEKRVQFYRDVVQRASQLPGVASAAYVSFPPLTMRGGSNAITIEGQTPVPGQRRGANNRIATSQYLQTLGVPLLRGRYFDDRDGVNAPRVAVINRTMEKAYWPGQEAIGKRFQVGGPDQPWYTVVGIVGDVKQMGLDVPTSPEVYYPVQASPGGSFFWPSHLVVRTSQDPMNLVASLRKIVFSVDPDQPIANVRTMDTILDTETASRETQTVLVAAFAGLALLLATVGLYGVLSFSVAQRTPEIGLRMALGAKHGQIVTMVVGRAVLLATTGIIIGLATSYALTRSLSSLLFEIEPTDPWVFASMAAVLLMVAAVASFVPARRAATVDPVVALRHE